jgi:hypothetical protein
VDESASELADLHSNPIERAAGVVSNASPTIAELRSDLYGASIDVLMRGTRR